MKRYHIIIELADGNRIDSRVVGRNKSDALQRLKSTEQYINLATSDIIAELVEPINIDSLESERFAVTAADNKPGWYIITDSASLIKIEWKKNAYNKTQRILHTGVNEHSSAIDHATALREIGEYLSTNFSDLI